MQSHLKRLYIIVKCGETQTDRGNRDNNRHINHIYSSLMNNDVILMYDKAFNIDPNNMG